MDAAQGGFLLGMAVGTMVLGGLQIIMSLIGKYRSYGLPVWN